ncbi:MAG: glycosyltransferase [Pseudomonadota bacterium]
MRLLMSASRQSGRLTESYARALTRLGCEVIPHYGAAETRLVAHAGADKIINRTAPALKRRGSNNRLLAQARKHRPDLIWLFKGMDIQPRTLRQLREDGHKIACLNADHPFEHYARGAGNRSVADAVALYDVYLTYSARIAGEIKARHARLRTEILPFGHELDDAGFANIAGMKEVQRACFVGTPDAARVRTLRALSGAGVPVDVYGHGWARHWRALGGARIFPAAEGEDLYPVLRAYRVQLNLFRPHNVGAHNMRSFEVPAAGGVMLAPASPEHERFFEDGGEAIYFSGERDMIGKAKALLAKGVWEIQRLRNRARRRSAVSGYHYRDRARAALAILSDVAAG